MNNHMVQNISRCSNLCNLSPQRLGSPPRQRLAENMSTLPVCGGYIVVRCPGIIAVTATLYDERTALGLFDRLLVL